MKLPFIHRKAPQFLKPNEMTKSTPTAPGWYFFRIRKEEPLIVIEVFIPPGYHYLVIKFNPTAVYSSEFISVQRLSEAFWAGPIPEPG